MSDKRYSKEEVVELMYDYRRYAWDNGCSKNDCHNWLKVRGFIDEPKEDKPISIKDFDRVNYAVFETLGDNEFDIDAYIGELNRQRLAAECDKSYNTPIVNEPTNKRKQYSVQDEIERKEREMARKELGGSQVYEPSLDKVMKAIERAEDRGRTNSKHILTLQQAVNTLLDDKIEGTWWSRLMNRNN